MIGEPEKLIDAIVELDVQVAKLQSQLTFAEKQILDYEQTEAAVCPEDVGIAEYVGSLLAKLTAAKEREKRLSEFTRRIINQYCWNYDDPDGGDIQELAEKLGLVEPHVATAEDVDDEFDDYEVGDTIFKFTDMLKE